MGNVALRKGLGLDLNPYARSSSQTLGSDSLVFSRGTGRGPSIYIVLGGLLGGLVVAPYLLLHNDVLLVGPPLGCLLGGALYRLRSRNWPVDPTARWRQLKFIVVLAIVSTLALVVAFLMPTSDFPTIGLLSLFGIVAFSLCLGVFASGRRRHGELIAAEFTEYLPPEDE